MNPIDNAREAILAQLSPIEHEAKELRERLNEIEANKAPLEAALDALGHKKKAKPKAERKAAKPYARKADVQAVCLGLVEANTSIHQADLEELVKHKLGSELGFNLSGVSLRLGECLSSDAFLVEADGTVLIANNTVERELKKPVDG